MDLSTSRVYPTVATKAARIVANVLLLRLVICPQEFNADNYPILQEFST
jgi:hypothetical protein